MKKFLTYLLLTLISLTFITSCGEEEEPQACDLTAVYTEYNDFAKKLTEMQSDPTVTCEEQKSFGQEVYDFYTSNKSCLFDAIDTTSPSTEEATALKNQLESAYTDLNKALQIPCP